MQYAITFKIEFEWILNRLVSMKIFLE